MAAVYRTLYEFLSTPSARRATWTPCFSFIFWRISIHALREEGDTSCGTTAPKRCDFYPRPPRGGRRTGLYGEMSAAEISIHALREEGDTNGLVAFANGYIFLSTPSARRATATGISIGNTTYISIHALREEGDDHPQLSPYHPQISIHALREEGDQ